MQPSLRTGPSTLAALATILGLAASFVGEWASSGEPPTALGLAAAGLAATLALVRSWQANVLTTAESAAIVEDAPTLDEEVLVDDLPLEPTDLPGPPRAAIIAS